ncbi:MAG: ABC transporter permease subunit [Rhizobiales bacterium]|nr:ABC transporter permease subunit [Hyphomicrobiales bacterium]
MTAANATGRLSLKRGSARSPEQAGSNQARPAALAVGGIAVFAALLAIAPLASLAVIAFGQTGDIWLHLIRYVVPTALVQTMLLLAGVAAVTIVIGVGAAWAVTTFEFPGRNALSWMLALPLALPTYIVAYIYVDLLGSYGPVQSTLRAMFGFKTAAEYWFPNVRSLGGAILLMGLVLYPYVYLAARAMFQTQAAQLTEAARMLGARPFRLALQISLPLARPAIAVGVALALLETLNDIGASEYLGVQTLTISIFTTWLNRGSLAGAAQIACIMLIFVAALIALERYGRRGRAFTALSQQGARFPSRIALKGPTRFIATLLCLVPVVLGFLLPAGFLISEVIARGLLVGFEPELIRPALTTVALAAAATALVLVIGFAAIAATRYLRRSLIDACVNVAGIGYAIPGTVLALGLLTPLVLVDEGINAAIRALGGGSVGLILAGSVAALIIAYVIRFLAIALGFAQAGFARIAPEFDDVARMLGAGPATLARTIHLPLVRPAIFGAALLVFVDCLKELPATLLLRPLNVETLSTYIYQYATRGSFEEGSLEALIIILVGIPAVLLISRHADAQIVPNS